MAEEIIVSVTQEDLSKGVPRHPRCCPIARALTRCFPDAADLYVLYSYAYLRPTTESETTLHAKLPEEAADLIEDVDSESADRVRPMEFKLQFTEQWQHSPDDIHQTSNAE